MSDLEVNSTGSMSLNNQCAREVEEIVQDSLKKRRDQRKISEEQKGQIAWRIANCLMAVFFFMAACVQFNDPDPYLWVPLYGTASLLTLSIVIWPNSSRDKKWIFVYILLTCWCTGMFIYVIVEFVTAAMNPESDGSINPLTYEEGRELAGVMITAVWTFICKQSPTIRCSFPNMCRYCNSRNTEKRYDFEFSVMQDTEVS